MDGRERDLSGHSPELIPMPIRIVLLLKENSREASCISSAASAASLGDLGKRARVPSPMNLSIKPLQGKERREDREH